MQPRPGGWAGLLVFPLLSRVRRPPCPCYLPSSLPCLHTSPLCRQHSGGGAGPGRAQPHGHGPDDPGQGVRWARRGGRGRAQSKAGTVGAQTCRHGGALRPARSPWLGAALTALPADLLCLPGPTPPQRWRTRGCTTSVPAGLPRSTTPSECLPAAPARLHARPHSAWQCVWAPGARNASWPGRARGREGRRADMSLPAARAAAGATTGWRACGRRCGVAACCGARTAASESRALWAGLLLPGAAGARRDCERCAHAQPLSLPSSPWPACLSSTCRRKGATLGCFKRTCRASYHLACARKYNCLLQVRAVRAWHGGRESERG